MSDWTPWQIIALIAVFGALALGIAALGVWYSLARESREWPDLSPEDRAAGRLGEAIGECGAGLTVEAAEEVLAIFARSSGDQKRALAAAIRGLLADGRSAHLPDLTTRVLAVARPLGGAAAADERIATPG